MREVTLIVIAKAPMPGRVKTRLCPPLEPAQAARLARAALEDTLAAVHSTPARRHVLALDGEPGDWLPEGFDVIPQCEGGLGARLASAFVRVGGPGLLVGMDTPQVTTELLGEAVAALEGEAADAVLGPAEDGGYWAIGLKRPCPTVFDGVPMSSGSTAAEQRRQLTRLGMTCEELPSLRDVDTIGDARAVADECPGSRFAAAMGSLQPHATTPHATTPLPLEAQCAARA